MEVALSSFSVWLKTSLCSQFCNQRIEKAQFLGKVAQIAAETKNGKISTLLIVQNIYMKPPLKCEVPSSYHV
jgi:hypothetical protein